MASEGCGDLQFTDNLKGAYSIMWSLHEFSKLSCNVGTMYKSRAFDLRHNGSTPFRMVIYPGGIGVDNSGYICCGLLCNNGDTSFTSSFDLLDSMGKKIPIDPESYETEDKNGNFCNRMIDRSDLMFYITNNSLVVIVYGGYSTAPVVPVKGQEIRTQDEMPPSDYALLYESGRDADAVITVDGQEIPVHSLVLSAQSKVFSDAFSLHPTREHLRFEITDFKLDIVKLFLQFLYCGTVRIDDLATACELVRAGHAYSLENLKRTCTKYLCANINDRNVVRLMVVADAHDAAGLRCDALEYFVNYKKEIDLKRHEADLVERPKLVFDMLCMTRDAWSNLNLLNSMTENDFEVI